MLDQLSTLARRPLFPLSALALCSSLAISAQTPTPDAAPPPTPTQQPAPIERQPPSDEPAPAGPMQTGRMRPHMRPGMMRGGPNSRQAGPGSFRGNGSMQYGQNRGPGGFHGGPGGGFGPGRGGMGPGMGAGFHIGPGGMWWKNPMVVQRLTLTPDQVTRMDAIFQKSRIDLIDLKANLEKQEVTLEPMLSANPPDTPKASLQIDKVADARASLEKANAKMLLSIRGVLTPDQWTKLSAHEGSGRFAGPGAASPGTAAAPAPPTTGSGPAPATPPRRQRGLHPPAPTQTTPPPS